jgi:dynein heavy chain
MVFLEETKRKIEKTAPNEMKLGLFTLKIKEIKQFLVGKAEEQKKMILSRINDVILYNIKNITEQY